jgi:hypothetical protein
MEKFNAYVAQRLASVRVFNAEDQPQKAVKHKNATCTVVEVTQRPKRKKVVNVLLQPTPNPESTQTR